jgi:hypothetical protein
MYNCGIRSAECTKPVGVVAYSAEGTRLWMLDKEGCVGAVVEIELLEGRGKMDGVAGYCVKDRGVMPRICKASD